MAPHLLRARKTACLAPACGVRSSRLVAAAATARTDGLLNPVARLRLYVRPSRRHRPQAGDLPPPRVPLTGTPRAPSTLWRHPGRLWLHRPPVATLSGQVAVSSRLQRPAPATQLYPKIFRCKGPLPLLSTSRRRLRPTRLPRGPPPRGMVCSNAAPSQISEGQASWRSCPHLLSAR